MENKFEFKIEEKTEIKVNRTNRSGHNTKGSKDDNRNELLCILEKLHNDDKITTLEVDGRVYVRFHVGDNSYIGYEYDSGVKVNFDSNGHPRSMGKNGSGARRQYLPFEKENGKILYAAVYTVKVAMWKWSDDESKYERYERLADGLCVGHRNSDSLDNRDCNLDVYDTSHNNWVTSIMTALEEHYPKKYTDVVVEPHKGGDIKHIMFSDRDQFITEDMLDMWQECFPDDRLVSLKTDKSGNTNMYSKEKTDRIIEFFDIK